jgi:hypothetical protein
MPNETLALAIKPPAAPSEDDFLALCAALSESVRGRAFLAEYARRNRNADTEALLVAIGRIEARLRADASAVQRLRDDLRMLLIAIRLARPEIDAADPATQPAKLTKLLDLLERRIDAMAEVKPADATPDEPAEAARAHLAVVPPPDEPELPIPSPTSAQAPAIVLVHDLEKTSAPSVPAVIEASVPAPPPDPLAALMALSEDERLALFT